MAISVRMYEENNQRLNTYTPLSSLTTTARRAYLRRDRAIMMAKASKFILFFYIISLLRPAVPMVADVIAHTFYEQQHIMQVHEVQGQFHIHDEIGKNLAHGDQEKGAMSCDVTEYAHPDALSLLAQLDYKVSNLHIAHTQLYTAASPDVVSPPPCI